MKLASRRIGLSAAILAIVSWAMPAVAAGPAVTQWGKVRSLQSGWTIDRMLVFHGAEMVNPEGCSITTNGYVIDEAAPGRSTFHMLLLSALLNSRDVQFVVLGCFADRPRIISVSIQ